jgi:hypothetical protein
LIDKAVSKTLDSGYRTPDIGQPNDTIVSTTKMKDILIENFNIIYEEQALGVFTN